MTIITYHGSTYLFNQFDFSNLRINGTEYGVGFYTTTDRAYAKQFTKSKDGKPGYLYTYDFQAKKPLSLTEREMSQAMLEKLFRRLHEDIEILWNYEDVGYYGIEAVLERAIEIEAGSCDNDVDLINSIIHSCGDPEVVFTALYEEMGYTHIEVLNRDFGGDFYIALIPSCLVCLKQEKIE